MKKILLILAAIMTLGASSVFAYDYCGSYRGRHNNVEYRGNTHNRDYRGYHENYRNGSHRNVYHYQQQNLTQAQITKIQELESKYFPQIDALKREIYNQNQIINFEMSKENPDQNTINNAIDQRTKISSDLQKLRLEFRIERNKIYASK